MAIFGLLGGSEKGGQKYGPGGVKIPPYFPSSGALKICPKTNVNNIYKGGSFNGGPKKRGGQKYGSGGVKISPYFPSSGALKIYPKTNVNNIYKGLVETEVQKRGGQ